MRKYKNGDFVKLKPLWKVDKGQRPFVAEEMEGYFGKEIQISYISKKDDIFESVGWSWSFDWIDNGVCLPDELFQI